MRNSRCLCVVGYLRVYRLTKTHSPYSQYPPDSLDYRVSSIDADESRHTGKYDSYIGMRNVTLGVFCNAITGIINLKTSNANG